MNKSVNKTPLWVELAFSSIKTRKAALILIAASVLFALYCIPWVSLFPMQAWLGEVFLIEDWSWAVMMVPVVIWYGLSLRWMDRNTAWAE